MKKTTRSSVPRAAVAAAKPASVLAWEDDPMSTGAKPVKRPVPDPAATSLKVRLTTAAPKPRQYARKSANFRHWNAADALARGATFWAAIVPGLKWQPGAELPVKLDAGEDLNAFYDRTSLSFFHDTVGKRTVYSGLSPDVILHEMGHAILDALRPQLWDVMSDEVAAFHESFGDMAAILCGLQLASVRTAVLKETGGSLYQTSRLSRLAEELGWAIRTKFPGAASPDCLRNAVNSFFYAPPSTLPASAPDNVLSSEPHSFSRVFTGAFFEMLANMLKKLSATPSEADLKQAAEDAARLLVRAVKTAPITDNYYSQVAVKLVAADKSLFAGRYAQAVTGAFVRRGILALHSVVALPRATTAAATTEASPKLGLHACSGDLLGLSDLTVQLETPDQEPADGVRSTGQWRAQAVAAAEAKPDPASEAAVRFAKYLVRRGRVDFTAHAAAAVANPHSWKTHRLVKSGDGVKIERRTFDCGLHNHDL